MGTTIFYRRQIKSWHNSEPRKDKEVNKYEALDKVFDTQVITGIIGDKFHFIEAKKISCIWRKETDKKDGIKVTIVTEENQLRAIKVKVNGTLNDELQIIWLKLILKFNW